MSEFQNGKYIICNDLEQPSTVAIAELLYPIDDTGLWMARYICEAIGLDQVHVKEGDFKFIEDFGIELDFFGHPEMVTAHQVGKSKATYPDGQIREWQDTANTGVPFLLKNYEVINWAEEFEKQFDGFLEQNDRECLLEFKDRRLNRIVQSRRIVTVSFGGKFLDHLKTRHDIRYPRGKDKYTSDWNRMSHTMRDAFKEAKRDIFSRQIVISNMDGFYINMPCFMTFQFLCIPDRGFVLSVNQRSLDKIKFYLDLRFFGEVIAHFEKETEYSVFQLDLNVGDIHREK